MAGRTAVGDPDDDLLQLPEQVQALVAVQRRTEEQLLALTKRVEA